MRLSKLSIRNFRNFQAVNISLSGNVVLLEQNRVGKSNLLFAIQLILDPTLPDSARQLKLTDFWDGGPAEYGAPVEVHLELSDFAADMALTALLTDFRAAHDPTERIVVGGGFRQSRGRRPARRPITVGPSPKRVARSLVAS